MAAARIGKEHGGPDLVNPLPLRYPGFITNRSSTRGRSLFATDNGRLRPGKQRECQ